MTQTVKHSPRSATSRKDNQTSLSRTIASIIAVVMVLTMPTASAYMVVPDHEVVEPQITSSLYSVTNVHCNGEYTIDHNINFGSSINWKIFKWELSGFIDHSTSIDYAYECTGTVEAYVTGMGGVNRLLGIRGPAGEGISVPGISASSPLLELEKEEELEDGCKYTVGGCSFSISESVSVSESKANVDSRPTNFCPKPQSVVAFNRINVPVGTSQTSGLPIHDPHVETLITVMGKADGCVGIQWSKVDSLDLAPGLELV